MDHNANLEFDAANAVVNSDDQPFKCMGCHVTDEEARRLRVVPGDVRLFHLDRPRSQWCVPICHNCAHDHEVLSRVLGQVLAMGGKWTDGRAATIEALMKQRDRLLMQSAVDAFAARYSETNGVLNRQWGAINEVRKLLGLDVKKNAGGLDAKRTILGALAGALIGAGLMSFKDPLRAIKEFWVGVTAQAKRMGYEVPDLSSLGL